MVIAKVHIDDGSDFESEIADLTVNSLILRTDQEIPLRTALTLEMLGIVVKCEVVYICSDEPRGLAVAFNASGDEKKRLEEEARRMREARETGVAEVEASASANPALDQDIFSAALRGGPATSSDSNFGVSSSAFLDALHQGPSAQGGLAHAGSGTHAVASANANVSEGLAALVAQFEKAVGGKNSLDAELLEFSEEGRLNLDDTLEAAGVFLSLLSGRPLVAKGCPTSARIIYGSRTLECSAQAIPGDRSLIASADKTTLKQICGGFRGLLLDAIDDALEGEDEPPVEEVPKLGSDGKSVEFQSFKHFVVQYIANISKGALVVAGPTFSPGTKKDLVLSIPGVSERVKITGRASFQGDGSMGYMLQDISLVQGQLAQIAAGPPPSKQAQRITTGQAEGRPPVATAVNYRGFLAPMGALDEAFEFEARRPSDVHDCKGWLARVFDFLFENHVHGVCVLSHEDRKIELWIHEAAVVFTRVTPGTEQDKLGRMLVIQKKTSRSALQTALSKAEELGQPIGRTLVGMGELDNSALNSALRYQVMKRVFEARGWTKGKIEVGPWSDPPIRTGLVMTSGKSILVNLIREEVRRKTLAELEDFAEPYLDRVFELDLQKQDPSFGLKKKERRFFEKAAGVSVNLRDLPKAAAVTNNEAYRYVILGCALGLMTVGKGAQKKTQSQEDEEILVSLKEKIASMNSGNQFEVLGLHWACIDREIGPAFKKKKREFLNHKDSSHAQVRVLSTKALDMIEKAHDLLMVPGRRKKYRDEKITEDERKHAATNMLDQVQILLVKDDVVQGQVLLKTAQEIFPSSRGERLYSDIRDGSYKLDI